MRVHFQFCFFFVFIVVWCFILIEYWELWNITKCVAHNYLVTDRFYFFIQFRKPNPKHPFDQNNVRIVDSNGWCIANHTEIFFALSIKSILCAQYSRYSINVCRIINFIVCMFFFLLASKLQNFAYKKSLPDIHEKWPSQHNRQKAKQIETWKFRLLWGWIVMRFSCDRKGIHMMALVASVQCLYGYSHAWLEFYCKHNQMCGLIRLLAGCMRNERMTWTVMPWLMMPHISRCNQYGGKEKSRK